MKDLLPIEFDNTTNPKLYFNLLRIEHLMKRDFDKLITNVQEVNSYHILFATEHKGEHHIDFKDYKYKKGEALTVRKNQIHKFYKSPVKGFLLSFTADFLVSYLEELEALNVLQLFNELLKGPKIKLHKKEYRELLDLIENLYYEYAKAPDEYAEGIIRSTLHIFITKLFRAKSRQIKPKVEQKYLIPFTAFQQLVEQKCFETKTVKDYAHEMGCSTKTLNSITQGVINKSSKAFIDDILIKQIKRYLINSKLSIKEIARKAGFDEPSNLYKYFKKFVGTTPELFRQNNN